MSLAVSRKVLQAKSTTRISKRLIKRLSTYKLVASFMEGDYN